MFCPFCGSSLVKKTPFCEFCGRSLNVLKDVNEEVTGQSSLGACAKPEQEPCPSYQRFMEFRSAKSKERQSFDVGRKRCKQASKRVQINIGLMVPLENGMGLKPVRGKTLPLFTDPEIAAPDLLEKAVQKMRAFNKDMTAGPFVLLYPDCSEVVNVPGSDKQFQLLEYKKEIGKAYSRITLFICLESHFKRENDEIESSDSEIIITSRSTAEFNMADTLPYEPQKQSTPKCQPQEERSSQGHSSTVQDREIIISDSEDRDLSEKSAPSSCYRQYTELYAPYVEEEEEEPLPANVDPFQHATMEETDLLLPDVISELSRIIDHTKVSRFNISRSNVWDGAVRGFRRPSFSEASDMLVKFSDDAGIFEEGFDMGGPRREFLTLLMKCLKDRPIFDGPDGHRFLVYNAKAVEEDEYYLAGKMIAVSVVHGGPGPHFLSEDLVNHLAGQKPFKGTVDLVTDTEVGKALHEIQSVTTLDALRKCTMRHSTMLQTAGCLRHLTTIMEKTEIVSDYLSWYIVYRNSSVIDRFKEGLSTLQFLTALQQHPNLLAPVLCFQDKPLTAVELERLFTADLSPQGSKRRRQESQTLSFWADYLLDCEEHQAAVTIEEVLMFATGLASLPPSGFEPSPSIAFLDDSPLPVANTCANVIKLPLSSTYDAFKSQMDFGIQNSPGFGCF